MKNSLVANLTPSASEIARRIESAISCFDTLGSDPKLVRSEVTVRLRGLLDYLSEFDDANRFLVFGRIVVDDDWHKGGTIVDDEIFNSINSEGSKNVAGNDDGTKD